MADKSTCKGHSERRSRENKIRNLKAKPCLFPDQDLLVRIKKGPGPEGSKEVSLKMLEEEYENSPEWKVMKEGGVLSIPMAEFRMINPPRPGPKGQVLFREKKTGVHQIDSYPTSETIKNLRDQVMMKYNEK